MGLYPLDTRYVDVHSRPIVDLRSKGGRSGCSSRSGLPLLEVAAVMQRDLLDLPV